MSRHFCQDVCPWNRRFARELPEGSPSAPREFIAGKDARQLALELLLLSQEEFSAAFKAPPMTRAKLRGLQRNAMVVLRNNGREDDIQALARALDDGEPSVREHAASAKRGERGYGSSSLETTRWKPSGS